MHLASFDLSWFTEIAMANLGILFMLVAVMFYFCGNRKVVLGTIILWFSMLWWNDFSLWIDAFWLVGSFLLLFYITKMAAMIIAESVKGWGDKLIIVNEVVGISVFLIWALFLR